MRALRRWLLRFLALVALGGVGYGVYTIVKSGTEGPSAPSRGPVQPALANLADSQEALAVRLQNLRRRSEPGKLLPAIRAVLSDRKAVVEAIRARRAQGKPIPDDLALSDALGAEFDYLDALRSVVAHPRSRLIGALGNRAQKAKDAFIKLPDSAGVEDGIRGTQAFLAWARARR